MRLARTIDLTDRSAYECEVGFLLEEHPLLLQYLTPGDACTATAPRAMERHDWQLGRLAADDV